MKQLTILLCVLFSSTYAFSQDMMAGTWKYQSGNEVFSVNIWKTSDGYKGHYKKITVDAAGNQLAVVYDSNKEIGTSGYYWPNVINAGIINQNNTIGGVIKDNTITNAPNGGNFIEGKFKMQILNPACYTPPNNSCALQAQWTVKKDSGLQNPNEPTFNIPTNITLIKQ